MSSNITAGPTALLNNPPIQPQYFQPSNFIITNVNLGLQTTVTTFVNHNYVIGQNVRLVIPEVYGCYQLNESESLVISIPSQNQVILALDSSQNVNPYVSASNPQKPQINAIGSINSGSINSNGVTTQIIQIPGSFSNISP